MNDDGGSARLQEELDRKMPGEPAPARNNLSTHPPTAERIKAFRGMG